VFFQQEKEFLILLMGPKLGLVLQLYTLRAADRGGIAPGGLFDEFSFLFLKFYREYILQMKFGRRDCPRWSFWLAMLSAIIRFSFFRH
jgi:hypothetical protein